MNKFKINSKYKPSGDQPEAIKNLCLGLKKNLSDQVLLGVTGSGKTFTMANVIQSLQRPSLVFAPNKILAAQLFSEMKSFFQIIGLNTLYHIMIITHQRRTFLDQILLLKRNHPINEQIDRLRHSATRSLIERNDTIIVASVSCIYGIGSAESYSSMKFEINRNHEYDLNQIKKKLVELQYKRNDQVHLRGTFRNRGDVLEIFPSHLEDKSWRISFFGNNVESIKEFDPFLGTITKEFENISIYANSHYVTPKPSLQKLLGKLKLN